MEESHVLHVYLLQYPDFYGLESAWAGREYLEIAKRRLGFKKLGNDILTMLGGRPIHPISVGRGQVRFEINTILLYSLDAETGSHCVTAIWPGEMR